MNNRIAVIGDVIVDEYIYCERIKDNPEHLQGSVYNTLKKEIIAGGASAVAILCKSLNANVDLFSISGTDYYGMKLSDILGSYGINSQIRHSSYITTVKRRYVVNGKLYNNRFDDEEKKESYRVIIERWLDQLHKYSYILISDYGKGIISDFLLKHLPSNKIILVDPAIGKSWGLYEKATIIKANRKEADIALQETKKFCLLKDIAITLSDLYDRTVIVTAGEIGLYYSYNNQTHTTREHQNGFIPSIVTNVRDICGAGDTIFAVIGTLLSQGYDLKDCCQEAVKYASQQIQSIGIKPLKVIHERTEV